MNEKNFLDSKYEDFKSWKGSGWRRWILKYLLGSLLPLFIPLFYKFDNVKIFITSFLKAHLSLIYNILSPWWMQLIIIVAVFLFWPLAEKIMEERLEKQKND